jgi:hypothetical protein
VPEIPLVAGLARGLGCEDDMYVWGSWRDIARHRPCNRCALIDVAAAPADYTDDNLEGRRTL